MKYQYQATFGNGDMGVCESAREYSAAYLLRIAEHVRIVAYPYGFGSTTETVPARSEFGFSKSYRGAINNAKRAARKWETDGIKCDWQVTENLYRN